MRFQSVLTVVTAAFVLIACSNQQAGQSAKPDSGSSAAPSSKKVLVLTEPLPPGIEHEVLGVISVFKRWFGGTGEGFRMLGDKAREIGANAVVEARVTLRPAFPANVAPHGNGKAVRVKDEAKLEELGKSAGRWE